MFRGCIRRCFLFAQWLCCPLNYIFVKTKTILHYSNKFRGFTPNVWQSAVMITDIMAPWGNRSWLRSQFVQQGQCPVSSKWSHCVGWNTIFFSWFPETWKTLSSMILRRRLIFRICELKITRRRMAREGRGAGSSLVSMETPYYKQYIKDVIGSREEEYQDKIAEVQDNSLHRKHFYTQKLLHTDAFTHKSFYTQKLLHTEAFTHKSFHTQKLLQTDTFTHRPFYTQTLVHTKAFTHRSFYTDAFTQTLLHTKLLPTEAFTYRSFYTQTLLHRRFYTQTLLTKTLLTKTLLHTGAFTHRSVDTQTLLHTNAFTHRSFYT